jgi:hypothetical protein
MRKQGARIGVLRLDAKSFGIAVALTVLAAISAYLLNSTLDVQEQVFVLAVFYVAVHTARWAWDRVQRSRGTKA